jgi:hypothetical protein
MSLSDKGGHSGGGGAVSQQVEARSLRWLHDQVHNNFPEGKKRAISEWIKAI